MSWKKFTYRLIAFIFPVAIAVIGVEALVRNIPNSITISSKQLKEKKNTIEAIVLGASQNKRAINPEHLSATTLTVAGTRQGHKTDYYLLKDLHKQLPNLKRVFLGTTARHFESRPNSKNFWKYRSHLVYYKVNAFERPVYFKDKFIYLGNPNFYSDQLEAYYLDNKKSLYNKYGFQLEGQKDRFKKLMYQEDTILETYNPNNYPSLSKEYLAVSTSWFYKTLNYCLDHEIEVILIKSPTYKNYRPNLDPAVIKRRDSIVLQALKLYPNTRLFDQEENAAYKTHHFLNENHLNPEGALIFTKRLEQFIKESTSSQN